MSERRVQIALDVSNITVHHKLFMRTGIQEVEYRTLLEAVAMRSELKGVQLTLLPFLPRQLGRSWRDFSVLPYPPVTPDVLREVEREAGLSSQDVWGFDLSTLGYQMNDDEVLKLLTRHDHLHVQGLVNLGPIMHVIKMKGSNLSVSATVHDLVPIWVPEYCDDGVVRWYENAYFPSLCDEVSHAICVSRNTALDLRQNFRGRKIRRVSTLALPFDEPSALSGEKEAKDLGLTPGKYIVYLGSLEPRKNFPALLSGFEHYIDRTSSLGVKLLLIGGTGWKSSAIEKCLARSRAKNHIVRAGYVADVPMRALIRASAGVAMLSHYEGFGLPVAQAFAQRTPVLTSLASSLPEACLGQAVFVDPSDPESVCAGIHLLVSGQVHRPENLPNWSWASRTRALIGILANEASRDHKSFHVIDSQR